VKELSSEQRLLVALVLSVVVITVSDLLFFRRVPPAPSKPTASQTASPSRAAAPAKPPASGTATAAASAPSVTPTLAPQPAQTPEQATKEESIVVESPVYRVVLSNRGAVVTSWQLLRYHDDSTPPKILDVVHPPANSQSGEWPLSFLMTDPQLQAEANRALFVVKPATGAIHAPATVDFSWSNGHLSITKQIRFTSGYVADVRTSVTLDGKPVGYALAWRGGFGDATVYNAYTHVQVFYAHEGKVETLAYKNLGASGRPETPANVPPPLQFAGIEDQYFAAAFLPAAGAPINAWDWRTDRAVPGGKPGTTEPVSEVAVGPPETTPGPVSFELFVGPKSLRVLGSVDTQLRSLVNFGIMGFLAEPLFYVLRWIHGYVSNWGWSIVLLTVGLTMALFPLRVSSWRSMQKMQKVMPEMKAIQARYKKYPMRDPRRQKMNEEMMELYQREGVNPLGSCLPMVLQMPVWFALFEMLEASIELRHAPWIGWIHDLSAHDPYYVLPILMTVAGYFMQKMTPMTTPDPAQQKMMNFMPVIFGLLFFRLPSGLILYIFTSYLLGIAQQWYLNKTSPISLPGSGPGKPSPKKKLKRQAVER
jgi:YidC/Oxa1 family membrane protein insertase